MVGLMEIRVRMERRVWPRLSAPPRLGGGAVSV